MLSKLIDWLVHLYPPITRKRRCAIFWTNPHPLRSWPFSKLSCWRFDIFPSKFAACSKPPSRDNYRKASYPRTQQRDQGAGWTHDPAIRVIVKTTPLPIRPRCRQVKCNFTVSQTWVWGQRQSPQLLGDFLQFFEIKSYFNAIGSHFAIGGQVDAKR